MDPRGGQLGSAGGRASRAGFTILEVLMSLIVIGILMGALLVGVRAVTGSARDAQQRADVSLLVQAASRFESDFGRPVPLVRLGDDGLPLIAGAPRRSLRIYGEESPELRRRSADANSNPNAPASNPFYDLRGSEFSLAYFLVGAPDAELAFGGAGAGGNPPIDGVVGPGMYPPAFEGEQVTFAFPSVQNPDGSANWQAASRTFARGGEVLKPYFETNRGQLRVVEDPAQPRDRRLRGPRGFSYRYYRWSTGPAANLAASDPPDRNIPWLVAQDPADPLVLPYLPLLPDSRNLAVNASLRSARWAVVGPGPDGFFGDEGAFNAGAAAADMLLRLGQAVGKPLTTASSPAEIAQARYAAARDNIVEVGR